ncbi:MAG: DsbE family thiol:disulfide interchange protein [Pelagibacteraceae bacterium]|jgi:cytochrome c biogenesis protein CcmG/thiol:disulfide interchange protein DsbE|nr:DsbE family thiol:disulfide interchange protein [Pelagibacteraceae bacterium]MBT4646450.1 DsbE family thiol:disulfide interchange protein [Pelagibacteraceae bacterium]MBT4950918.1 DsbE family thiol:disulfide interchange protein [Pelagibacteraceae bacterium]MBT6353474.1 DsbE family thiol:disulfide interchange protein [Pelagibacteraceae bacterium]
MKKIVLILPLILLTIICLFFLLFILLEKNPNEPPSALLYKDLPTFTSNNLYNKNINLGSNDLKEKYTLINFFASWCTPCRVEHHFFFEIKKENPDLFILGLAHKDDPNDSKKYLEEEGNPYSFVGLDQDGKIAFEFGVFGLPETFIVNSDGKIIFKHTGPLTKEIIKNEITKLF